jgi:hypothetical protein
MKPVHDGVNHGVRQPPNERPRKHPRIRPIPFGTHPGPEPFNASEIVAIDDSRFLFCDNNVGDSLFGLRLAPDGQMACPLTRHPLRGVEAGTVDDLECMALVRQGGRCILFASPSFSLKRRRKRHRKKSKRGKPSPARSCLLRISFGDDDQLDAEVLPGFREWLVDHASVLGEAPRHVPDDGGLNVEGLAWSPADQALLLGVRTPVIDGRPLILRVRPKRVDGPWDVSNFEMLPAISLAVERDDGEQGIRSIEFDPSRGVMLIVLGNSTSDSKAPFALCSWDGNAEGVVQSFEAVRFHKRMKVEGVTPGQVGGRGVIVFVDDAGGYQILWDDDPRLG